MLSVLNNLHCDNSITINNFYMNENNFTNHTLEGILNFYANYYNLGEYIDLNENSTAFNFVFWLNMFCSAYLWSNLICLTYVISVIFIIKKINISIELINLTGFIGCLMGIYLLNTYRIIYINLILANVVTGMFLWILSLEITKYFNYNLMFKSMMINMSMSFLIVSTLAMTSLMKPFYIF
jgi:hypothetical protein